MIPYTEIEKENITLDYNKETAFYKRESGIPGFVMPKMNVYCNLTNTTRHDGNFTVNFIIKSQGSNLTFEVTKYVKAGDTVYFSDTKEINHYSFENGVELTVTVVAPTIEVEKEVTKYREEVYYSVFD
jgi:plastocyanin